MLTLHRKIKRHGGSLGIILPPLWLDEHGVHENTPVRLELADGSIKIIPEVEA